MLVDASIGAGLDDAGPVAAAAESARYDGAWAGETNHDPFLRLLLAAEATDRIEIGSSVAIAFARNPMNTAILARDVNDRSGGRFLLGLGSQVKPHIERRFSMPWSSPAARMREYVSAMRAIWGSWQEGTKLDFRGDFYTHTLMPPLFAQAPSDHGLPRVLLAAVGEAMTRVAAEVADGLLVHPFSTPAYLAEVTLPAVRSERERIGSTHAPFQVVAPIFVATGSTEEELGDAISACRKQIAFYASTPTYRRVLEHHGWGDLQTALTALSKEGRWDEMGALVDDEMLSTFAVVGEPNTAAEAIVDRYGELVDRVNFYMPYRSDPAVASAMLLTIKSLG
ncbi:MAG: putative F420-dependent oxidoreductase, family [Aeromicrobium sp.]|nr:putative F420-dependent oxidoreductase, family [Aeromicrobium sp.]